MNATNKALAQIFKEMGAIYEYLDDKFRAIAYHNASRVLESMEDDLSASTEKELAAMKGIGHGIAQKIIEYCHTGKIEKYNELKSRIPAEFIGLLEVKGFGPESLKKISTELKITSRDQLIKALKDGSIAKLKGFGKKKVENMLMGLNIFEASEKRILLWEAWGLGNDIISKLKELPGIQKIELAGSIRRQKETIGDLDILAAAGAKDRKKVMDFFISLNTVKKVLAKGGTKSSVMVQDHNRQVDLRIVEPDEWGAALQYFTGSKEHNVHIREIAKEKGLKVSEYGVFDIKTDKKLAGRDEIEVYENLGLQWIPPEMRENGGEIELAQKYQLPELVTLKDIRGDLHMHSDWSDGNFTIKEIARYIREHYPHYEYIAITDHTKAVRIAGGIEDNDFLKQIEEIREINEDLGKDFVKAGAEVDINIDGTLDLPEEVLSHLDWVVASVHTRLNRDNTERIVKACENSYVNVIGHPTGRMMGVREAYPLDMEAVINAAKATGTALEINAQPHRIDLNDRFARMARERGVKFIISTDSHSMGNYAFMPLGLAVSRRAWCTADDILNTKSWKQLKAWFSKKKKKALISEE